MKNAWKWQSLAGLAGLMFGLIEALASVSAAAQAPAAVAVPAKPLPSIVERAGRYSLLVDGEPLEKVQLMK